MSLYPEMEEASLDQLILWWNSDIPKWADDRRLFMDEVAFAMTELGQPGIEYLKQFVLSNDIEWRKSSVYFLADKSIMDEETVSFLKDAYFEDDPELKWIALLGFIKIEQFPFPRELVEQNLGSLNQSLSGYAMIYLSYAYPDETDLILRNGLLNNRPKVRMMACDEIGDRNLTQLRNDVERLRTDPDRDVRQAANTALEGFDWLDSA